jgi:hypothetical protein
MTRNILDSEGNIIGEMTLPDETTEEEWQAQLLPYATPKAVPVKTYKDVTPRQIRQALILSGITLSQIDDAINSLPEPTQSLARVEWEYSIAFQRNRPLVAQVAQMLQWTSEQVDALWELAGTL